MRGVLGTVAKYLGGELGLSTDDQAVVAYGLEVVLSNLVTLLLAFVGGLYFGVPGEVALSAIVWFVIRQLAGGAHCSTLWRCAFLSSFILIFTGFSAIKIAENLGKDPVILLTAGTFLVLIPTFFWAPAPNHKKPLRSNLIRKKLRCWALLSEAILVLFFLMLVLKTLFISLAIAGCLAMILACLMLTPAGYRVIATVDRLCGLLLTIITGRRVMK
jgi:accessory gene regulator B